MVVGGFPWEVDIKQTACAYEEYRAGSNTSRFMQQLNSLSLQCSG